MNDNNELVNEKYHYGLLAFPKLLIEGLKNTGAPVQKFIDQCLIKNFNLAGQQQYLPLHIIYEFFETVYEYNNDPVFWDKITKHFKFYNLGLVGKYLCSLSNFVDFIDNLSKYDHFFYTNQNIQLSFEDHKTIMTIKYCDSTRIGKTIIQELFLLLILKIIDISTGKSQNHVEIYYPDSELKIIKPNSQYNKGFKQNYLSIVVQNKALSNKFTCNSPNNIHAALLQYPPYELSKKLEYIFENNMCNSLPTLDLMAKFFNLSPSALKRRLALGNNTYQNIIDHWRLNKAMNLILESRYKMSTISDMLYYSDNANFTRAFKRWVGVTPRSFRKMNLMELS